MSEQPNNPLHGVTLAQIVEELVDRHGWEELAHRVPVRCFSHEPSVNSSLKFLRKTPWARSKIEAIYLADQRKVQRNRKRNERRAQRRAIAEAHSLSEVEASPSASVPDDPQIPSETEE